MKTLGQIAHDAGKFDRQWHHMGESQKAEWERIAQAVIEAQQVAVPPGWVPAPIEPTPEAIELLYGPYLTHAADESRKRSYKEMLAAAPQPPQGDKP